MILARIAVVALLIITLASTVACGSTSTPTHIPTPDCSILDKYTTEFSQTSSGCNGVWNVEVTNIGDDGIVYVKVDRMLNGVAQSSETKSVYLQTGDIQTLKFRFTNTDCDHTTVSTICYAY